MKLKKLYSDIFADEDSEKWMYFMLQIAMRHQTHKKKKNKVLSFTP